MSETFETFSYRAVPMPLRRRLRRRSVKVTVVVALILFGVASFARWVTDSERASFRALALHTSPPALISTIQGSGDTAEAIAAITTTPQDIQAQNVAHQVMMAARHLAARGSFADAGPAQLAKRLPAYTFVEGPSPIPQIVSVTAAAHGWAVAVAATTGRCFMIRVVAGNGVRYGSSSDGCSSAAAMHVTGTSW
jgi:hypothetical protein